MSTYIALLRGVNVSGQKKILMQDLRDVFTSLDFSNVSTYIQSGNVLFNSEEKKVDAIIHKIEQGIEERYGFSVRIIVKTPQQLNEALVANPYHPTDMGREYITFLAHTPENLDVSELTAVRQPGEKITLIDDVIYFLCPEGYGKTKLSNSYIEKVLGVSATTRNIKTVTFLANTSQ